MIEAKTSVEKTAQTNDPVKDILTQIKRAGIDNKDLNKKIEEASEKWVNNENIVKELKKWKSLLDDNEGKKVVEMTDKNKFNFINTNLSDNEMNTYKNKPNIDELIKKLDESWIDNQEKFNYFVSQLKTWNDENNPWKITPIDLNDGIIVDNFINSLTNEEKKYISDQIDLGNLTFNMELLKK